MSQLYIRVKTGFYTHRKTAMLMALLGSESKDDAYWIPPRLWAYCAENQPDGNLSGYSSEQVAMLIGCPKHATSIIQALKTSGFVDQDGHVHDWEEHNGYHKRYSARAKAAADARWAQEKKEPKKRSTEKVERGDKHCYTHACSIPEGLNTAEFQAAWNEWGLHRNEIRKKLTPLAAQKALKQLEAMGVARAIAAINHSITNGYQGIYESHQSRSRNNGHDRNAGTANEGRAKDYAKLRPKS